MKVYASFNTDYPSERAATQTLVGNPYDAHQAYVQAKRKLHEACTI